MMTRALTDTAPSSSRGPKGGKTQWGGGEKPILLDWRKDANAKEPKDKDCYCRFQLPAPDFIYGLRGDYIYMQSTDKRKWDGSYARGLRFYYKASAKLTIKPTIQIVPNSNGSNDLSTLNSECVGQAQDPAIRYRIEIRFHDLNPVRDPDNPHADAEACSLSMRKLFPPMDQWIVNFGNGTNSVSSEEGRYALILGDGRPVDCGAHTLLFNDGGLLPLKTTGCPCLPVINVYAPLLLIRQGLEFDGSATPANTLATLHRQTWDPADDNDEG